MELKDKTYRLDEMVEAIENSMENIDKVVHDQRKLQTVINTCEEADDFVDLSKSIDEQINSMIEQKKTLEERVELIKKIIELCEVESNRDLMNLVFEAFGIFRED